MRGSGLKSHRAVRGHTYISALANTSVASKSLNRHSLPPGNVTFHDV